MNKQYLLLLLFSTAYWHLNGQTDLLSITGTVLDNQTQIPLIGAAIYASGLA